MSTSKRWATRLVVLLLAVAPAAPAQTPAQAVAPAPAFTGEISGAVKAGNMAVPGVTVSAANSLTGQKVVTSTDAAGKFALILPGKGRYVVRAEMTAFAPATKEVVINPEHPNEAVELEMQLLSRVQAAQQQPGLQQLAGMAGRGFQNLAVAGSEFSGMAPDDIAGGNPGGNGNPANGGFGTPGGMDPGMPSLPQAGMGENAATESVAVSGQMGRSENMGVNLEDIRERVEEQMRAQGGPGAGGMIEFRGPGPGGGIANIQIMGGGGGMGGGGPMGGMGGSPMMIMIGGPGGGGAGFNRFNVNRPHGAVFYNAGSSALDAAPYSLTGLRGAKPEYMQNRFGASIGGPLNIPKIYQGGQKTFFFVNYMGSRSANPYDAFATVPTLLERAGDFSQTLVNGAPVQVVDPVTRQPFVNNRIPTGQLDPAAVGLLNLFPTPNQAGAVQNFHFVSANDNRSDNINFHLVHNFGATQPRQPRQQRAGNQAPARGGRGGAAGRGPGGRNFGRRNNLNLGFNYSTSRGDILNPFPSISGQNEARNLNVPIGYTRSIGRVVSNTRVQFNRSRLLLGNRYQNAVDVAGQLGIAGVSQNPFDFGAPTVSLTHYNALRDINPQLSRNQTLSFSEGLNYSRGKHNWRFGGDFRRIQVNPRSSTNARGAFTFTGLYSGYDLADFLLGRPQQTSAQFGVNGYYFRGNSWDLYVQDDWRVRGNLTLNLGLRYEYISPFSEKYGRIVNLDANRDFTAAAPVQAGEAGAFTGEFPQTLVDPDRNNLAPRVGIAWKPFGKSTVRAGYGVNYNTGAYGTIVQQMAFQPPFTFTQTNVASATTQLTLRNGFPAAAPGTVTNNFGVARDYRLGYVQGWNLGVQQELLKSLMMNVDYHGSKGTRLDIVRAPNRNPNGGLRIAGVQPFLWQDSLGASTMHSLNVRVRKRMQRGISLGGNYTWSKSLDNASSIGGGGSVVAQNDLDLQAERGLSSFDVRHRFSADYVWELPFGTNKRWLSGQGALARIFGDWMWTGNAVLQSGSPFTARVLGNFADVARGTNGTLRADYTGQPIALDDWSVARFFNTAAFTTPAPGQFGSSRRNMISGPGAVLFDMSVSKTVAMRDLQGIEFRLSANNVFNTPRFAGIDTAVNSPSYGRITAVGSMRKLQLSARYRF